MVMPRKLMEFLFPGKRAWRACESSGNSFRCGVSFKGRWCFQVKLKPGAREELREKFKHCLCGDCLAPYTTSQGTDSDQSRLSFQ
jgi:hypothetical protein